MNDSLKAFGALIGALMAGRNLNRDEAESAFTEILTGRQSEIHQGAFLAAITAKGPTAEEIAGACKAIASIDTVAAPPLPHRKLVDNCGTGMDGSGTFNISTAASLVAAAAGCQMARHGARAVSSTCGTVDVCEALGVDVQCPVETVCDSIVGTGIGLFNGTSAKIHPAALGRILSQMRFGSILNIAASLANPSRPTLGVRGVYAPAMVEPVAQAMRAVGYHRAMVFHGRLPDGRGMDELTPVGENIVVEIRPDGGMDRYTLLPEKLGLAGGDLRALAGSGETETEALGLVRLVAGIENGIRRDAVCLNAAPILLLSGVVDNLSDGMALARETLAAGRVLDKLRQWVEHQQSTPGAGRKRLQALIARLH